MSCRLSGRWFVEKGVFNNQCSARPNPTNRGFCPKRKCRSNLDNLTTPQIKQNIKISGIGQKHPKEKKDAIANQKWSGNGVGALLQMLVRQLPREDRSS